MTVGYFSNVWKLESGCCCCSVAKSCLTLCDPVDCSMSDFPVLHYLAEFAQTHVRWVSDAIQPSHSLLSPSPPGFSLSQKQGLIQWISSSCQVAKALELQLQSFQCIYRATNLKRSVVLNGNTEVHSDYQSDNNPRRIIEGSLILEICVKITCSFQSWVSTDSFRKDFRLHLNVSQSPLWL